MATLTEVNEALQNYLSAASRLRQLGITPNKRDFTCQIGEWLVSNLYG